MSDPHQRILNTVQLYIQRYGIPPTVREVAADCHYSSTNVYYHLGQMARMGLIDHIPNETRGIRLKQKESLS